MKSNLLKFAKEIATPDDIVVNDNDKRICILFVNFNSGGYLGQPVINDCEEFAQNLKETFGYKCFFICNSKRANAKEIIKKLISMENKKIAFYYSGHGTRVRDTNGDERDGMDEAFCFNDGVLIDDDFCKLINEHLRCKHFICITDACHSGTIYDIDNIRTEKRGKMTCISSCSDNQTAKQLLKNGIFTLNFWKCYDKNSKRLDVKKMNKRLDWFDQMIVMYPSDNDIIDF